jgi:hypothetical protein
VAREPRRRGPERSACCSCCGTADRKPHISAAGPDLAYLPDSHEILQSTEALASGRFKPSISMANSCLSMSTSSPMLGAVFAEENYFHAEFHTRYLPRPASSGDTGWHPYIEARGIEWPVPLPSFVE